MTVRQVEPFKFEGADTAVGRRCLDKGGPQVPIQGDPDNRMGCVRRDGHLPPHRAVSYVPDKPTMYWEWD